MDENGKLSKIDTKQLYKILGGDYDILTMAKAKDSNEKQLLNAMKQHQNSINLNMLKLKDLYAYKFVGRGRYGPSMIVCAENDHKILVLKATTKKKLPDHRLRDLAEFLKVTTVLTHTPFTATVLRLFEDTHHFYLLQEFVEGLMLSEVCQELGLLKSSQARFYVASMILALEYMHSHDMAHRDVKLENMIIDEMGYFKLIDFSSAKLMPTSPEGKPYRTYTLISSPFYTPPEALMGRGYTKKGDFWQVGVGMYKMLTGKYPFGDTRGSPQEIFEDIITKPLIIPSYFGDDTKDLLHKLLSRTPEVRLGESFAKLKMHPWFDGLDWDKLNNHKLKAPYRPLIDSFITQKEFWSYELKKQTISDAMKNFTLQK